MSLQAYATVADMVARFGQREMVALSDLDNQAVQAATIERKLADAHALADGYMGMVWHLPLQGCTKPAPTQEDPQAVQYVPPPMLTRIVCDVARYYLYDDKSTDEVLKRYEQAIAQLLQISQGKATLSCPWGGVAGRGLGAQPQTGGAVVQHCFAPRQITDASLQGFEA